jgi:hypothetical protein
VDAADPDTVIVSATDGPGSAYWPRRAKTYGYRKTGLKRWELAMSGLPEAKGTTAARFATHAGEPGVIYAANNHGLFRSDNAGLSWKALELPWPEPGVPTENSVPINQHPCGTNRRSRGCTFPVGKHIRV